MMMMTGDYRGKRQPVPGVSDWKDIIFNPSYFILWIRYKWWKFHEVIVNDDDDDVDYE
jgi:hypothetical protein